MRLNLWALTGVLALGTTTVVAQEEPEQLKDFVPEQVFENVELNQIYDLTGTYVKKSTSLTIKNIASEPQSVYYYAIESDIEHRVSVLEARASGDDESPLPLEFEGVDSQHDAHLYKLVLPKALEAKEEFKLEIASAITGLLKPLPESAEQDDTQHMYFESSRYGYSAYPTKELTTVFKPVGTQAQEIDVDEKDKPDVSENRVMYGPYKNLKPYTSKIVKLRFETPKAMAKVTKLTRDVWVSHWGSSVSFEETYWVHNFGTKLKDSFSRLKYQMGQNKFNLNIAALKELVMIMKPNARDAYYTDLVGNVSTSNFRTSDKGTVFTVKPRFPVFGGWNYNFTIGWSQDLQDFVKNVGNDEFLMRVPFVEGPRDIYYDEIDYTVILPEGATDINVLSLLGTTAGHDIVYSYLDTIGRPAVHLQYNNIIDGHRRTEVYVKYKFTTISALRKVFMISTAFLGLFSTIIFLSNVNLNIVRNKKTETNKSSN